MSRAYLHAPVRSETYVERCAEDMTGPTDAATCWKLKRAMCGTRSAAQDWHAEFEHKMQTGGITTASIAKKDLLAMNTKKGNIKVLPGQQTC